MNTVNKTKPTRIILILVTNILFIGILLLASQISDGLAQSNTPSTLYFPIVQTNLRQTPAPKLIKGFPLEGALCPNDIEVNPYSGITYITNERSANISIIRNMTHLHNVSTGVWPIYVESDPYSDLVYITHVVSGIYLFEGGNQTGQIPPYVESYTILPNPINGYTYITDLHRPITILKGKQKITDLFVPDFQGHQIQWQLAADYDEATGLSYFASWQKGVVTVVDGTTVVDQFNYIGAGAKDMVINPDKRLIYITNFRAGDEKDLPKNNISIINIDTKAVTPIISAGKSAFLDIDEVSGYVYVTNHEDNTVTVLNGTQIIATYPVGKGPWGVTVDSRTGYAFVANSGERSISIFKDGLFKETIDLPHDEGFQPWNVAVDPVGKEIYVLSRSSRYKDSGNPKSINEANLIQCREPWVHIFQY